MNTFIPNTQYSLRSILIDTLRTGRQQTGLWSNNTVTFSKNNNKDLSVSITFRVIPEVDLDTLEVKIAPCGGVCYIDGVRDVLLKWEHLPDDVRNDIQSCINEISIPTLYSTVNDKLHGVSWIYGSLHS